MFSCVTVVFTITSVQHFVGEEEGEYIFLNVKFIAWLCPKMCSNSIQKSMLVSIVVILAPCGLVFLGCIRLRVYVGGAWGESIW